MQFFENILSFAYLGLLRDGLAEPALVLAHQHEGLT